MQHSVSSDHRGDECGKLLSVVGLDVWGRGGEGGEGREGEGRGEFYVKAYNLHVSIYTRTLHTL